MVRRQVYYRHCEPGEAMRVAPRNRRPAGYAMDVAGRRGAMSSNELDGEKPTASRYDVAVLVPCYDEARAIAKVVADFRAALPQAVIYVYDNNSTDGTVEAARTAGAVVRRETHQGKGHVVRRMFNDIEADIYVLVDGDATYDASSAPAMITSLIEQRLDMLVATRIDH